MKKLAIIPARGGSKRLPKKNIKPLNGKPLINYTLEAVVNSGVFDTVILSSDDDTILEIGSKVHGVTPEKREAELAGDKVKVIDLIKQIADRPGYDEIYDVIALFLPTCPFRIAKHVKEGFQLLNDDVYSVVSINEMKEPIQLSLTMDEKKVIDVNAIIDPSPLITGNTRSQDFDTYYRVNGGFYMAWLKQFKEVDNFFQGKTRGYEMPVDYCVDIDEAIDFEWAEFLLNSGKIKID